ncbi:MAG: GTP cyclohydrolase MptA [Thermoplasmata archaeon]|nr:GTP cyclohydrolase MptA [Thermoplasmata archaeon]
MRDVHAMRPRHGRLSLRQVGVSGVKKPLHVRRSGRVVTLSATFRVVVDLPPGRKGSDLSRNAELLAEVVDRTAHQPVESLEAACSTIARDLLVRHPTASESRVEASADYFLARGIDTDRESLEDFRLFAEAVATRASGSRVRLSRSIGAEAIGMTACPCAMETCREQLLAEFPELAAKSLATLPMITHNQRNRTRLSLDVAEGSAVEADDIIAAIEAAQSSPTYAILKRGDEARLVVAAHRNPKFVEDVLRDLLASLPARFPHLPGPTVIRAVTTSEESIHKYDVVAEHRTTLAELRASARP